MALIVARHCVANDAKGLSPLQAALLDAPQRVRIADAPTGAGKTYAFQKAVARGERVLFIVPTRRLAQNIAAGLIHNLVGEEGWAPEQAESKVEIWTSDRSGQLREQGVLRISAHRIRQIQALDFTREGGEMVIAVPEVVSHLLLRRRMEQGQAASGIFEVLDFFEHIVFDEFHTIQAMGFGLAALCARLVTSENPDGSQFGRARVSFLSATPVDIRPVLEKIGTPGAGIAQLREVLVDKGRAVHGDVALSFTSQATLVEVAAENLTSIGAEVTAGRQVVLIYNRLGDLIREMPELVALLERAGVPAERILVINSIADSGRDDVHRLGYHTGRSKNPDHFSVLIATASIEMGVTFRDANLMLMEPGFQPMNFLQRYGRAARRGADGRVIVRHDEHMRDRNPWIRDLLEWDETRSGERIDIHALTDTLSASTRKAFAAVEGEDPRFFGTLPNRAAYTAGLYWQALMKHRSNQGPRFNHLLRHRPPTAGVIHALLNDVRSMEGDRLFGPAAKRWRARFEEQAYVLRDISKRIRVCQGSGNTIEVDPVLLGRETTILESLPVLDGPDGGAEVRLSGELEDYLRDRRRPVMRRVTVYFPHTMEDALLASDEGLVETWCRNLRGRGGPAGMAWDDCAKAMEAAEKLVRYTGLVPCDDDDLSLAASSGVL